MKHVVSRADRWPSAKVNGAKIVGQCEISHPAHTTPVVITDDGVPGQEDPDSMDQLLVQRRNVLFESDGKDAVTGLPSPISSKTFIFCIMLFLTCVNAQGSTTSTPTGTRYTHIPTLISSQIYL